jgi:hypothetical protein
LLIPIDFMACEYQLADLSMTFLFPAGFIDRIFFLGPVPFAMTFFGILRPPNALSPTAYLIAGPAAIAAKI